MMSKNRTSITKTAKLLFFSMLACLIVIVAVFIRWRAHETVRLESQSDLIETSHGLIEYSSFGEGPVVLVLHGTIGGYDQGLTLAKMLATNDYRFISVSRPGYLRTPLSTGPSFAEQADAYAALLDELEIDQVAIMAISGGGPPALQFALRHPTRIWGMVMIATNSEVNADEQSKTPTPNSSETNPPPAWLLDLIFSDFLGWLLTNGAKWQPQWILPALVGEEYTAAVLNDPAKYQLYLGLVNSFSLTSQRRIGSFNDGAQFVLHTGYPFENILAPMLILHGTKDAQDIRIQQQYLDETVPLSKYLEIEGGTHFMPPSHNDVLRPLILDFLATNLP